MSFSNCSGCKHSGSSRSSGVCFWCYRSSNWTPSDGYLVAEAIKKNAKPKDEEVKELEKEIYMLKQHIKMLTYSNSELTRKNQILTEKIFGQMIKRRILNDDKKCKR